MNNKRKTALSIAAVIALIIFMHTIGWLRPIEHFFRGSINATSSFVFSGGEKVQSFGSFFKSKQSYTDEIERLSVELDQRYVDQARLNELEDENARLLEQLNFFETDSHDHVGARVVGRSIDPIGTTIIIDKGTNQGVQKGNSAIVGTGVLIGRVVRADENSSVVQLINDTKSRVAVTVLNSERSIGVVEGGFGIVIRMNFIPQNEEINPGDIVVTSGLEDGVPRGLAIGTIAAVEKKPQEPFQGAVLDPIHNLNNITLISVLTSVDL